MKKIWTIIKAKLLDKDKLKGTAWYDERIELCKNCPLNSINNMDRGFRYWLWDILNLKKPFCTVCGCEIKAKASVEFEECPKGKWKEVEIEN